jgi:hypothetical protein
MAAEFMFWSRSRSGGVRFRCFELPNWARRKMKTTRGEGRALPLLVVLTACGGPSVASSTIGLDAGSVQGQPDGSALPRPLVDGGAPDGAGLDGASPTTPLSDAFVNATIGPAYDANNNNLCVWGSTRAALTIGANGGVSTAPTTQADGSSQDQDGGLVDVLCSVTGAFDVNLSAGLGPSGIAAGGVLQIVGHVDAGNGGVNVTGTLGAPNAGGNFSSSACTVTFKYNGGAVPASPAIAAGRIWAHVSCPIMLSENPPVMVIIGSSQVVETCDVEADFLFENCSQ